MKSQTVGYLVFGFILYATVLGTSRGRCDIRFIRELEVDRMLWVSRLDHIQIANCTCFQYKKCNKTSTKKNICWYLKMEIRNTWSLHENRTHNNILSNIIKYIIIENVQFTDTPDIHLYLIRSDLNIEPNKLKFLHWYPSDISVWKKKKNQMWRLNICTRAQMISLCLGKIQSWEDIKRQTRYFSQQVH